MLLGLGDNCHMLSLFPGIPEIHEQHRLVVPVEVEDKIRHRVTMTAPVMNNSARIMFLISGANKAAAVKRVLEGSDNPDQVPAHLVAPKDGVVIWMMDKPAASQLSPASSRNINARGARSTSNRRVGGESCAMIGFASAIGPAFSSRLSFCWWALIYVPASPSFAVFELKRAIDARDGEGAARYVNFESVVKHAGYEMVRQKANDPLSQMVGQGAIDLFSKPLAQATRAYSVKEVDDGDKDVQMPPAGGSLARWS